MFWVFSQEADFKPLLSFTSFKVQLRDIAA